MMYNINCTEGKDKVAFSFRKVCVINTRPSPCNCSAWSLKSGVAPERDIRSNCSLALPVHKLGKMKDCAKQVQSSQIESWLLMCPGIYLSSSFTQDVVDTGRPPKAIRCKHLLLVAQKVPKLRLRRSKLHSAEHICGGMPLS